MQKLLYVFAVLVGSAAAQIPCPSNEVLNLPPDAGVNLPRVCVNTSVPITKSAVLVSDVTGLAAALKCGTTVSLKPGHYGSTVLPSCTAANPFVIKSAGKVPAPGQRFTPTGGYQTAVFDHIVMGNYNRIGPGIEVGQTGLYDSILIDARNVSHPIIIRNWIHGNPKGEVAHAVMATGSDHFAFSGNWVNEIHCINNGKCGDSQAVLIGCAGAGAGFLVENNHLESSGENFMSGGCGQMGYTSDVIVRRNHLYKPMAWMGGTPRFLVKNSLELKSCLRCLIEDNILENSWGGFSQNGYSMLLTSKTQSLGTGGVLAQLTDIVVRNNSMSGGSGIQIAAAKSDPPASLSSLGLIRFSIHGNLIAVDNKKYVSSSGIGMQLTLQDNQAQATGINISNNTWTGAQNSALMLGAVKAGSLTFTNNILFPGTYNSTSTGAQTDCSKNTNTKPAMALTACWTSLTFTGNVVVGGNSNWPGGTLTPALSPFVSVNAGDYSSTIPNVGADFSALQGFLAGVQ